MSLSKALLNRSCIAGVIPPSSSSSTGGAQGAPPTNFSSSPLSPRSALSFQLAENFLSLLLLLALLRMQKEMRETRTIRIATPTKTVKAMYRGDFPIRWKKVMNGEVVSELVRLLRGVADEEGREEGMATFPAKSEVKSRLSEGLVDEDADDSLDESDRVDVMTAVEVVNSAESVVGVIMDDGSGNWEVLAIG